MKIQFKATVVGTFSIAQEYLTYLVDVPKMRDSSPLDEIPSNYIVLPTLALLEEFRDQDKGTSILGKFHVENIGSIRQLQLLGVTYDGRPGKFAVQSLGIR